MIKAFFTSSQIFTTLLQFGELSEEVGGVWGSGLTCSLLILCGLKCNINPAVIIEGVMVGN